LSERFSRLQEAFDSRRLDLRTSAQNDDPDLVLVLETIGAVNDFIPGRPPKFPHPWPPQTPPPELIGRGL
jgi:hypothetical protein